MSRYRTIDIRIHGDEVIASLSRPQPNARTLFEWLLLGPSTGIIPGLYRAREAQLADELGWELEPFRERFRELYTARSRLGFEGVLCEADWKAGLVWIPNAIRYRPPDNPNVILHWAGPLDELPECALKTKAYHVLAAHCRERGPSFDDAFKRLPKPSRDGSGNGFGNRMPNQEQDQDQDQDQEQKGGTHAQTRAHRRAPTAPAASAAPPVSPHGGVTEKAIGKAIKALASTFGHEAPPTATRAHKLQAAEKASALIASGLEIEPAAERVVRAAYELMATGKPRSFGFALCDCTIGAHVNGTPRGEKRLSSIDENGRSTLDW